MQSRLALSAVLAALAVPASAHHSGAMFDDKKEVEVAATVKVLQWTNPHSWLEITYTDAQGKATDVDLELGSPVQLVRQGWKPKTLVPGDKVTVKFHPHKDGVKTGLLMNVKLPNGTVLGSD
jgi:hypothetical protein